MIDKVVADRAPLAITVECGKGVVLVSAGERAIIDETPRLPGNASRLMTG